MDGSCPARNHRASPCICLPTPTSACAGIGFVDLILLAIGTILAISIILSVAFKLGGSVIAALRVVVGITWVTAKILVPKPPERLPRRPLDAVSP